MSKEYIVLQYQTLMTDLRLATDDDRRHEILAQLAKLTALASDLYGFDFADSLRAD